MKKISLLDSETIQKIAAGEVIERPASVVKELMENSADAEATSITVETADGGKKLIRISDDGIGISRDEIELAFSPHATSKLTEINDIYKISTYGFRGEALASISSVSKVEIITKTETDELGIIAKLENNKVISQSDIAAGNGTGIKIEDLFYNMPVRQKMLKSAASENRAILDVVVKQALAGSNISFKYFKDGEHTITVNATSSVEDRIYSLLGSDFSEGLTFFDKSYGDIRVYGGSSTNRLHRGTRGEQYLFINNRAVFVPAITKAIENYYKSIIPNGKFPCYVLYLEIPKEKLDINVHPNKKEVKLLYIDDIIKAIIGAIKVQSSEIESLRTVSFFKPDTEKQPIDVPLKLSVDQGIIFSEYTGDSRETKTDFKIEDNNAVKESAKTYDALKTNADNSDDEKEELSKETHYGLNQDNLKAEDFFTKVISVDEKIRESKPVIRVDDYVKKPVVQSGLPDNLEVIGVIFKTYILLEDYLNAVYIVDQHAAHERILYELFKREYMSDTVAIQGILVPEILTLSAKDKEIVNNNIAKFRRFGFEIEDFGGLDVAIRGVPMILNLKDYKQFFLNIIDSIELFEHSSEMNDDKIIKTACVNAIKAGDRLNTVSINDLITELKSCENYTTCPHGRPTLMKLSKKDFEQAFLRI